MANYVYAVEASTGIFVYGGETPYDIDPITLSPGQVRVELDSQPQPLTERWDGQAIRPATPAEIKYYRQAVLGQQRIVSKVAFLKLLTPSEYATMFTVTDPVLSHGVAIFQAASEIDLLDPTVEYLLNYCVQVNALTQARKDELWAGMQAAAI
jgi:hypothetical protein